MSRKVLRKIVSSVASMYGFSQSCRHSLIFPAAGWMEKFIDPMLRDAISGRKRSGGARRSSSVIFVEPPLVMLMTASVFALIRGRNSANAAGSAVGRPSRGSLACRWRIAAPASAASMACCAISCGASGRCGDIDGV